MHQHRTLARRLATVVAGTALTVTGVLGTGALGTGFVGTAHAVDEIAEPEPDPCEQGLQICGDKGPQDPNPDEPGVDLGGPGDLTDDPCNHLSHGCDGGDGGDGGDPEIDDLAPTPPVSGDPTFTG